MKKYELRKRDIKFRGISVIELPPNYFHYGNLVVEPTHIGGTLENGGVKTFIRPTNNPNGVMFEVKKETVGQFTGLQDKNYEDIYEGDIVKLFAWPWSTFDRPYVVNWDDNGFTPFNEYCDNPDITGYPPAGNWCEVIGNVFKNPELLKK